MLPCSWTCQTIDLRVSEFSNDRFAVRAFIDVVNFGDFFFVYVINIVDERINRADKAVNKELVWIYMLFFNERLVGLIFTKTRAIFP